MLRADTTGHVRQSYFKKPSHYMILNDTFKTYNVVYESLKCYGFGTSLNLMSEYLKMKNPNRILPFHRNLKDINQHEINLWILGHLASGNEMLRCLFSYCYVI